MSQAVPSHIQIPNLNDTYEQLLVRLNEAERKYKRGDVDEIELTSQEPIRVFEKELGELSQLLEKYRTRLLGERPSLLFKFLAIEAESKEYFDTATPSFQMDRYQLAKELRQQLPKRIAPDTPAEQITTFKNMIRVIVTGWEYLHSIGKFGTAIDQAEELYDYVQQSGLANNQDPAFGTRAYICYFIGRSLRQRGMDDDNARAIECFYQCSELFFDMARRRENQDVDVIYARTRAMVSLAFGAGFLFHNSQSDLVRAKALIAQARLAFLSDSGKVRCKLHYFYLEQLYASILRAEAGDVEPDENDSDEEKGLLLANREKLDRAIIILDKCVPELQRNPKYLIYVLLNKALVHIYQGTQGYADARKCIDELLNLSRDNDRLFANALCLKSHLERREANYDEALTDANKAYKQAGNHPPVLIEALLARGQAQIARQQFSAAESDIERAIQLNNNANLKMTIMGQLLLVELAMKQKKTRLAYDRLEKVRPAMSSISHGFILRTFRKLEQVVPNLQSDFVIPAKAEELNYKELEASLQSWLLDKARREEPNITAMAQRLNVSKKTIYLWLDKFKNSR